MDNSKFGGSKFDSIPLEWVRAFETTARLGSFTAAARETGLTQPAISQRIAHLEHQLGAKLFVRKTRAIHLTTEGEAWLPHVQASLNALRDSSEALFGVGRNKIVISASSSIVQHWITPRLPALLVASGAEITINTMVLSGDAAEEDGTVKIRYGAGDWPGVYKAPLFEERLAQMRAALGLCATRASGLKSQFGTMGKPYNAGIAASNGIECAQLARLDMTSCADGLMGPQGFAETHHAGLPLETADWDGLAGGKLLFADNKYKLHACCHGLHAMIEAVLLAKETGVTFDDVTEFVLRTNPRWLKVCDIKQPRTGLEVKFSYAWLAGMTLRGDATGAPDTYTDALALDLALAAFAEKVTVIGDDTLTDLQVEGILTFKNGATREASFDLAAPLPMETLEGKLRSKAQACLGQEGADIWSILDQMDQMNAREIGRLVSG